MKKTEWAKARVKHLMRGGVPRWIRCYNNGGTDAGGSMDQYTVCFTGRAAVTHTPGYASEYPYVAMNAAPFHPQGFGQHGSSKGKHCDTNKWGFAPMVGKRNHLGLRIRFQDLPEDCRKLVVQDYKEIWNL
jgi:hypothetical protein